MTLRTYFAAALVVLPLVAARADYVAQPGDVLEVTVPGAPALHRRVAIGTDGKIALPVLGEIAAAGTSLTDIRQRLRALAAARNVVKHPEVIISVVEYGPIYVDGDVAKPGEYRYRPEMTVRGAVALAGGLEGSGGARRFTAAQIADARGDYGTSAIELARQEARVARLKAELASAATFDPAPVTAAVTVNGRVLAEIVAIEARVMEAETEAFRNEKAHRERMLAAAGEVVAALEAAEEQARALLEQQVRNTTRARGLLQKGVGTIVRVEDGQRALAQARAQVLDARVHLAQARKEVDERARSLETFDDERRARLLDALKDAVAEAGKARFRLEAAQERLNGRPDTARIAEDDPAPDVMIRRVVDGVTVRLPSELDTVLQSGDNIEIRVPTRLNAAFTRTSIGP